MSLNPFGPPNWAIFAIMALSISAFLVFVRPRPQSTVLAIVKTCTAFIPFAAGSAWLFWSVHTIGSSGYVGPAEPEAVISSISQSFWLGAGLTCGLVILSIFLAVQKRHQSEQYN